MMFSTPMKQLFAVVLGKDKERVTQAMLKAGVMQFLRTTELDLGEQVPVAAAESTGSLSTISELRRRVEGFLHTVGIVPVVPQEADLARREIVNVEKESQALDKIDGQRESLRERQRALQQEILKIEDVQRQVKFYGLSLEGVKLPNNQSILFMRTGTLAQAQSRNLATELKRLPALGIELGVDGDLVHYLLIAMKRDQEAIDRVLQGLQWNEVGLPSQVLNVKKDLSAELDSKIQGLVDEQKKIQYQVTNLVQAEAGRLQALWTDLRVQELCLTVQGQFQSSARTVIFAGWLPAAQQSVLERAIRVASDHRCYLEWLAPGEDGMLGRDIPVRFSNPKWLGPFQMLVSNFGVPQYGTIDPTPFVMPLYLAMFGLMFADVGQGLVLAVLGALGVSRLKGKVGKEGLLQMAWLIIWCGCASMVFGALLGSYFGFALVQPLWFDFHGIVVGHGAANAPINDVYDILLIAIYFGIAVIGLGLFFNWINLVRTRQWLTLVFDKGGVLGGWMYAGGIYTATYMVTHNYKAFPEGKVLFLLLGIPALLLLLKEPLHHWQHRHTRTVKTNVLMAAANMGMEWIVELLEIFGGYLSNTLSFMRVAGLGIAHVCLMISFFTLAGMTDSVVMKVLILILGNVMVIGLEGLSAGIQALRLNYYEFFTKFFHGTGKLYTPIALNSEV